MRRLTAIGWAGAALPRRMGFAPAGHSQCRWDSRSPASSSLIGSTPGLPDSPGLQLLQFAATVAGSILQLRHLQDSLVRQQEAQRHQAARLQRLASFHAMLAQVNQLAAGRPDAVALFAGICRIAVRQGGFRLAWVGRPDASGIFQPVAAAGVTEFLDKVRVSTDPARPEGQGLAGKAWRDGRTAVRQKFDAETRHPDWWRAARQFGLGAGAALPLKLRGVPQAVLHVYAAEEGILDTALVDVLEELALDVGRALEAIAQQHHLEHLEALHSTLMALGEALLHAGSDSEMLHRTCTQLADSSLFNIAWIGCPDGKGIMRVLASAGAGIAQLQAAPFTLDDTPPSLAVRCWQNVRTVCSNDPQSDPDLARYHHLMEAGRWRSVAAVPVMRGGVRFAILALGAPQPGLFEKDVLALCERVAALLSRGLDEYDLKLTLEEERRQQFHLARHDALTDLPNRRQFNEHLARVLADARRRGTPLAVCMLDFDDFKPVNDQYGHAAGDILLRQAAQRLRDALRRSDVIARLGGDEFALAIEDFPSTAALPGLLRTRFRGNDRPVRYRQYGQRHSHRSQYGSGGLP